MKFDKKKVSIFLAGALFVTSLAPSVQADAQLSRMMVATDSNAEKATDSNATEKPGSNIPGIDKPIEIATDSNAKGTGAIDMLDPGPLLPATGGLMPMRMMRSGNIEQPEDAEGIEVEKTAIRVDDDTFKIRLESYVTGEVTQETVLLPTDVVLVLDVSGSMAYCVNCNATKWDKNSKCQYTKYVEEGIAGETSHNSRETYYYRDGDGTYKRAYWRNDAWRTNDKDSASKISNTEMLYIGQSVSTSHKSRLQSLKDGVELFIENIAADAAEKEVDHRVAIVKFASDKKTTVGNNFTRSGYNNSQIVKGLTTLDKADKLISTVNGFTATGATRSDYGMQHAESLLKNAMNDRKSQKVVIMFTDGDPTNDNKFSDSVAAGAITASRNIKQNYGGTVYTIGVFAGADGRVPMSSSVKDNNRYMHYVSSNFPNARPNGTSWKSNGGSASYPKEGSYYMSASDDDGLNAIFQNISDQIQDATPSIELDKSTKVVDVIADSFEIPSGTNKINVYTADYVKKSDDSFGFAADEPVSNMTKTIDSESRTVSVSGFDYSANFIAETGRDKNNPAEPGDFYGKKLIIEFNVDVRDGFLGGNNVPTNGTDSKVVSGDGSAQKHFEVPHVNVPIQNVTVTDTSKNVYLTGGLTNEQLEDGVIATSNGTPLDLSKDDYGLGDDIWKAEYVNIDSNVTPPSGVDLSKLMNDTNYTIGVTISPKDNGVAEVGTPATEKSGSGTGHINVYKPVLTYQDGEAYYGGEVPEESYLAGLKVGETAWKHGSTDGTDGEVSNNMIGDAPTVVTSDHTVDSSMTTVEDSKTVINTKESVPVTVGSIKIGDTDIKDHTFILRNKCEENEADLAEGKHFVLHPKTGTLEVTKTGGDSDEMFVMNIKRNGEDYTKVTVGGNSSVTLTELPMGKYTLEEDQRWAWRYEASVNSGEGEISKGDLEGKVSCTNKKNNDKWLDFSSFEKNVYKEKDESQTQNGKKVS